MLITHDVCEAIDKRATGFIKFSETEQEVLQSIRLFTDKSPFPQVVGAIDGSHITLKSVPVGERIEYFNRKQDYSIMIQEKRVLLMRLLNFLMWVRATPVEFTTPVLPVWANCRGKLIKVPGLTGLRRELGGSEIGPLLVGDSAYPLSVWLMKPFKQTPTLTESQLHFNRVRSGLL